MFCGVQNSIDFHKGGIFSGLQAITFPVLSVAYRAGTVVHRSEVFVGVT
jgi:hypothetical protein